jgi:hypothetical protein
MSASDAAPLPRMGEVFFDVRGSSRSMRLSWYADTGVAVFSIWQGGMCTGTFRLPMGDLARMIETLQCGPERRRPRTGADGYGSPDDVEVGYRDPRMADRGPADYGKAGYGPADYGMSGYVGGRRAGAAADYPAADYPAADYADRDFPTGASWHEDGGYQPDFTGQGRLAETDAVGYGQDRFVPPYVQAEDESNLNDNPGSGSDRRRGVGQPAYPGDRPPGSSRSERYPEPPRSPAGYSDGSDYELVADPGTGARHSAGKHSGRRPRSSGQPEQAAHELRAGGNRVVQRDYRGR